MNLEERAYALMWTMIRSKSPHVAADYLTGIADKLVSGEIPSDDDRVMLGIALQGVVKRNESLRFLNGLQKGRKADQLRSIVNNYISVLEAHREHGLPLSQGNKNNAFSYVAEKVSLSAETIEEHYEKGAKLIEESDSNALLAHELKNWKMPRGV